MQGDYAVRGSQNMNILTTRHLRQSPSNTIAVDPVYQELVTIHDRDYQKYSIDHSVHLVPVDEASEVCIGWGRWH